MIKTLKQIWRDLFPGPPKVKFSVKNRGPKDATIFWKDLKVEITEQSIIFRGNGVVYHHYTEKT